MTETFGSSIGKKVIVGLTGIGLVIFAITHLAGNLLLYVGPDAYNAYAQTLHKNPLLPVIEIGLLVTFLVHIFMTISLVLDNRKARGAEKYAVRGTKQEGVRSFASRSMAYSGGTFLFFLVVHVAQMRFGIKVEGVAEMTPYEHTMTVLSNPWIAFLYTVGSLLLGLHLSHGISSTLRSLGLHHSEFTPFAERWGVRLGVLLALGFASFPMWVRFTQ